MGGARRASGGVNFSCGRRKGPRRDEESFMLTNHEIHLIRQSFNQLAPAADRVAGDFYRNLFLIQPALQLLFPVDLDEQKKKLMQMLGAAINLLNRPEKLLPVLEELGRRHALYGVRDEHYETVGAALLDTLRARLGASFDAETAGAWTKMYRFVAETMIAGTIELSLAPDRPFAAAETAF